MHRVSSVDGPLDELYLVWLYSQVANVDLKSPKRKYWTLLSQLYSTEFVWFVPNDDSRVEDGRELRYEFVEERDLDNADLAWMGLGCSVLEMLVALSRRMAFETDVPASAWFWHIIENLKLHEYNDSRRDFADIVKVVIDKVIWRTYDKDGTGGLFPLRQPNRDQRKVEIWYQMSAYILEHS